MRGWVRDNLDAWTLQHWRIRAEPITFQDHKYLPWIYQLRAPEIVVQKCSQVGVSEWLLALTVWFSGELGNVVLYMFHATQSAGDFSQHRLNPVFEHSPYLFRLLKGEGRERRGADRVMMKRIGEGFAYFRPAREKSMTSVAADCVVYDEFDQMWDGAYEFGLKRLGNSKWKWTRRVSIPSIPDFGINEAFQSGTQHAWMIQCDHCNEWQELGWLDNVVTDLGDDRFELRSPQTLLWRGMDEEALPRAADVLCRKCERPVDRLVPGEWVPRHTKRETVSLKISRLMSSRTSIPELVKRFVSAKPEAQEHFWRSDMGETYLPKGEQVSRDLILNRRGDYKMKDSGRGCTMGVDVGAKIHYMVSRRSTGRRVTQKVGSVGAFEELDALMARYGVVRCVIDALPETRKAKEFAQRHPKGVVLLAYYKDNDRDATLVAISEKRIEPRDRKTTAIATISRTYAMDSAVADLETGSHVLPSDVESDPEFIPHMEGSKRVMVTDTRTGGLIPRWVKVKADHLFHANVYDYVAWTMIEPRKRKAVKASVMKPS